MGCAAKMLAPFVIEDHCAGVRRAHTAAMIAACFKHLLRSCCVTQHGQKTADGLRDGLFFQLFLSVLLGCSAVWSAGVQSPIENCQEWHSISHIHLWHRPRSPLRVEHTTPSGEAGSQHVPPPQTRHRAFGRQCTGQLGKRSFACLVPFISSFALCFVFLVFVLPPSNSEYEDVGEEDDLFLPVSLFVFVCLCFPFPFVLGAPSRACGSSSGT